MKNLIWVVLVAVILIGGYVYMQQGSQPAMTDSESAEGMMEGDGMMEGAMMSMDEVNKAIVGKWQSTEDAKFSREFKADGTAVDSYEGTDDTNGTWTTFTAEKPADVSFTPETDATYVQMKIGDETYNFKVAKVTADELALIYMDRGGTLTFTRVK